MLWFVRLEQGGSEAKSLSVGNCTLYHGGRVVCEKETETIRNIVLECDCMAPDSSEGNVSLPAVL